MSQVVPVQLEDGSILYIEAEDTQATAVSPGTPPISAGAEGEQRRSGSKGWGDLPVTRTHPAQSMQMVQATIRTYTLYCLNAFKNMGAANVEEVTLEFGVNLSADAGIPYIASGKAQSNLKITVKCSYKQSEPKN